MRLLATLVLANHDVSSSDVTNRGFSGFFLWWCVARTNLFHDPFLSFGDYHTWRPDEGTREWERIRNGPAYNAKLEFEGS